MNISGYLNFDLSFGRSGGKYRTRVQAPAGEDRAEFENPFAEKDLQHLRTLDCPAEYDSSEKWIEDLGEKLFRSVIRGRIETSYRLSLREARGRGMGLRLRLHLSEVPEIAVWPWEYLCDAGKFLSTSIETPIVRYLDAPVPAPPLKAGLPLRVLALMANPPGCEPLAVNDEWERLSGTLDSLCKEGLIELELLPKATLPSLDEHLRRRPCNVLHFVGHGKFSPDQRDGVLLLLDERGGAKPVRGKRLAGLLAGRKLPRLVVLNACEGARNSEDDSFVGIAPSLVRHGLAAVVAMQLPITDQAAIDFTGRFYQMISEGLPVDSAVTEARRAMSVKGHDIEWGTPVLYMRSPDGRLFDLPDRGVAREAPEALPPSPGTGKWQKRLTWLAFATLSLGGILGLAVLMKPPGPCPSPRGLDMDLVLIPPGTYLMGSEEEGDEKPVHEVKITEAFCLGAYEVTREQWEEVMDVSRTREDAQVGRLPVAGISYSEGEEFLRRLNKREGKQVFRLPTEAEWEYAARGGGQGDPSGNCLHGDAYDGPAPVGAFLTNDWGLYDMYGNVWEWVADWHGAYPTGPVINPTGPKTGTERVKRGGSFRSAVKHCRAARRNSHDPDGRANDLGFRIVRELD